jgi:hypothetical protein
MSECTCGSTSRQSGEVPGFSRDAARSIVDFARMGANCATRSRFWRHCQMSAITMTAAATQPALRVALAADLIARSRPDHGLTAP